MQRFDFVIRAREVSADEAKAHAEAVRQRGARYLSRYHLTIQDALRALTGHDPEPTAQAWRTILAQ